MDKLYELVGSGNLATATEDYANAIILSRNDESLPVEDISNEIEALGIALKEKQTAHGST